MSIECTFDGILSPDWDLYRREWWRVENNLQPLTQTYLSARHLKVYKEACQQVGMKRAPTLNAIIYPPVRDRRMERRNRRGEVFFHYLSEVVKNDEFWDDKNHCLVWVKEAWTFKRNNWDYFSILLSLHIDNMVKSLKRKGITWVKYFWVKLHHRNKHLARCYLYLFYIGTGNEKLPTWGGKPKRYNREVIPIKRKDILSRKGETYPHWERLKFLMTKNLKRYPAWMLPKGKKVVGHSELPEWANACFIGKWAQNIILARMSRGDTLLSVTKERMELDDCGQFTFTSPNLPEPYILEGYHYKPPLIYHFKFKNMSIETINPYRLSTISKAHLARVTKYYLAGTGKLPSESNWENLVPREIPSTPASEAKARKFQYFAERLAPQVIKFSNIKKKIAGRWVFSLSEDELEDKSLTGLGCITITTGEGITLNLPAIDVEPPPQPWEELPSED